MDLGLVGLPITQEEKSNLSVCLSVCLLVCLLVHIMFFSFCDSMAAFTLSS